MYRIRDLIKSYWHENVPRWLWVVVLIGIGIILYMAGADNAG